MSSNFAPFENCYLTGGGDFNQIVPEPFTYIYLIISKQIPTTCEIGLHFLDFKYYPIDLYRGSGASGRLWVTDKVFYPGNSYTAMWCKDVGIDSTCLRYAIAMDTLVWKVSQILYQCGSTDCANQICLFPNCHWSL